MDHNCGKYFQGTLILSLVASATLVGTFFVGAAFSSCATSSGKQVGVITQFSREGHIFKSQEGRLTLEGRVLPEGEAPIFDFSLDEFHVWGNRTPELSEELEKTRNSGERVEVSYIQMAYPVPWRGSTKYFVDGVKPLNASSTNHK